MEPPKDEPKTKVTEPCLKCEGSGKVTDDQFEMSLPAIRAEAKTNDRTRIAVEKGILNIKNCPRCHGVGKLPKGRQRRQG